MANLLNNGMFEKQTNLGWTFSFEANGKYPIIANRIFGTYAEAEAFLSNATAIPGIILRVVEDETAGKNAAYIVKKDASAASGLKLVKLAEGELNISGKMVNIVEVDGKFYNDTDDPEHTTPITDPAVTEAGKYLKLELGDDEVFINSKDLIDLTDYYTKEEVDEKLDDLDSSVSEAINVVNSSISEIKEEVKIIDSSIACLDSSVKQNTADIADIREEIDTFTTELESEIQNVSNNLNDLSTAVADFKSEIESELQAEIDRAEAKEAEIDSSIAEVKSDIADIKSDIQVIDSSIAALVEKDAEQDASIDRLDASVSKIEDELLNGVVNSLEVEDKVQSEYVSLAADTSKGAVTVTLDGKVVDASTAEFQNVSNNGLATVGYVEERLDQYNWITVEDEETPTPAEDAAGNVTVNSTSTQPQLVSLSSVNDDATSLSISSQNSEVTVTGK